MSTNENENEEQSQQESTPAQEPSTEQPSGQETEQFKFSSAAPSYLQGKNEQEAIDLVANLVKTATNMANNQSMQQTQTQTSVQDPIQQTQVGLPDPDLMLTDSEAYQRQLVAALTAQQQQNLAVQAQPIFNAQAETALFMSKSDKALTEVWESYGPEIEMQVAQIPTHLRTKAIYDQAAKLVKGNHVDEIAEKQAQIKYDAMLNANPGVESANSSGGFVDANLNAGSNAWDKISQSEIGRAQLNLMDKRTLLGMIEGGGDTLESYAEKVASSTARYDAQRGIIHNHDMRSFK